jgi:hypothetical protein
MAEIRAHRHLICALLVSVLLAGCMAGDAPDPGETPPATSDEPATPVVTATTGAVRGAVSTESYEPLAGAKILLLGDGRTTTLGETATARDGSFAFSELAPGRYVLQTSRNGYLSKTQGVTVEAGKTSEVQIRLAAVPTLEPYVIEEEVVGKITIGRTWQVEVPTMGCVTVPGQNQPVPEVGNVTTDPVPTCGKRNQYNSPNWRGDIELTNETKTLIVEMAWTPAGVIGEHMWIDIYCSEVYHVAVGDGEDFGVISDPDHPCYMEPAKQTSPVMHRVDEAHWLEHGYNFTLWHWRVYPGYGMLGTYPLIGVDAGVAYEQTFTLYISVFQRAAAPADYSLIP